MHGGVLDWLQSYLTERYFTVRHGGTESTRRVSIYGVPQGSVLGHWSVDGVKSPETEPSKDRSVVVRDSPASAST